MRQPGSLTILQARAEARAILFAANVLEDLETALEPLYAYAAESGAADDYGADVCFAVIHKAFEEVIQS